MKSQIPASRLNDPRSSHEAEAEINQSGVRGVQQEVILAAVRHHPGCTSRELTMFCDLDRYQIARRLADLESADLVSKGRIRPCRLGKRNAVTWYIKPAVWSEQRELF